MPDKEKVRLLLGNQPPHFQQVRLPGLEKPLEKLIISDLVQLRPASDVVYGFDVAAFIHSSPKTPDQDDSKKPISDT